MSGCANIINRLTSEVCKLRDEAAKTECMRGVLELNQKIFKHTDSLAYLVADDADHKTDCGVPVKVKRTEKCCDKVYDALLVNSTSDGSAVLVNTKDLYCEGKRECSGFFCFHKTLHVCVEHVDLDVLQNVDVRVLQEAIQKCATTECRGTLTLDAYNALLAVLSQYGIRSIAVNQAACIYKYLMNHSTADEGDDSAEPAEPNAPYEPSDLIPDITCRHISDTTTQSETSSNEQIELKLKQLLECTESTQ